MSYFYMYNPFAPRITSDGGGRFAKIFVDENTPFVTDVETWDFISTEANGRLTYRIAGGSDADFFTIDENTGELFFKDAPDYENPLDKYQNNTYQVQVEVEDRAGFTDSQTIVVKVMDIEELPVNEAPLIISNGGGDTANIKVTENTAFVTDVDAVDDNDSEGSGLTYSIIGGADADKFKIDTLTGELSFIEAPDFETPTDINGDNFYDVIVGVADAGSEVASAPIRVEAEDMHLCKYYVDHEDFASSKELIKTYGDGFASFNFEGPSGDYDIIVGYYDENDGQSRAKLFVNNQEIDAWSFDQDLAPNLPSADNFVTRKIENFRVESGDFIKLAGWSMGTEFARFDYIEFVPKPVQTEPLMDVQHLSIEVTDELEIVPASLGDQVYLDLNENGVQDEDEGGVAGVLVKLLNSDGTAVLDGDGNSITTITNADGFYSFTGLNPDEYKVTFIAPSGFEFTTPIETTEVVFSDSFEGDAVGTTPPTGWSGTGWTVKTAAGEFDDTAGDFIGADGDNLIEGNDDFVIVRAVDITGFENTDLRISLLANDGGGADTTLEDGDLLVVEYAFGPTEPGNGDWLTAIQGEGDIASDEALVKFTSEGLKINGGGESTVWLRIRQTVNTASNEVFAVDQIAIAVAPPDFNVIATTETVALEPGDFNDTLDAGLVSVEDRLAGLGNFVFEDLNANGLQDQDESGVAGVLVKLLNSEGTVATDNIGNPITTTTDADGFYSFTNLIPDEYRVMFVAPEGFEFTTPNVVGGSEPTEIVFSDSFEGDAIGTNPPTGWSGTGWTVKTATGEFDDTTGNFIGADGDNLIEGNDDFAIFRAVDITGFENTDLRISLLANDGGGADTTLEDGDLLVVEYAVGPTEPGSGDWLTAFQGEGDITSGETLEQFTSEGLTINSGDESTLWLRIRQTVNTASNEVFAVDQIAIAVAPPNFDTLDSDALPDMNGITQTVTLGAGEFNSTLDAGLVAI